MSRPMHELESKPSYWSVIGLVLWTAVVLLIAGGAVYLVYLVGRIW